MIKKIILITSIFIVIVIIVIGLYFASNNRSQSGETVAIFNKVNPLVKKENSYLKTREPDEIQEHNRASYTQNVYNENGESRKLTFSAIEKLKVDRYLMIKHKGAHVETYQEVEKKDIPKKAIEEIEK